jgi:hypothetical protein
MRPKGLPAARTGSTKARKGYASLHAYSTFVKGPLQLLAGHDAHAANGLREVLHDKAMTVIDRCHAPARRKTTRASKVCAQPRVVRRVGVRTNTGAYVTSPTCWGRCSAAREIVQSRFVDDGATPDASVRLRKWVTCDQAMMRRNRTIGTGRTWWADGTMAHRRPAVPEAPTPFLHGIQPTLVPSDPPGVQQSNGRA